MKTKLLSLILLLNVGLNFAQDLNGNNDKFVQSQQQQDAHQIKAQKNDGSQQQKEIEDCEPSHFGHPHEPSFESPFPSFSSLLGDDVFSPRTMLMPKFPFNSFRELFKPPFPFSNESPFPFISSIHVMPTDKEDNFTPPKTDSEVNEEMKSDECKETERTNDNVNNESVQTKDGGDEDNDSETHIYYVNEKGMQQIGDNGNCSESGEAPVEHEVAINVELHMLNMPLNISDKANDTNRAHTIPIKQIMGHVLEALSHVKNIFSKVFHKNSSVPVSGSFEMSGMKSQVIQCDCPDAPDGHDDNCPMFANGNGPQEMSTELEQNNDKDMHNIPVDSPLGQYVINRNADYTQEEKVSVHQIEVSERQQNSTNKVSKDFDWYYYLLIAVMSSLSLLLCVFCTVTVTKRRKSVNDSESNLKVEIDINKDNGVNAEKEKKNDSLVINM